MESLTNFAWLQEICQGKVASQIWHNNRVLRLNEIVQSHTFRTEFSVGCINPDQIIGIDYGFGYNFSSDISWIELLNSLHRFHKIRRNLYSYNALIEHIHSQTLGDEKCVYQIEDKYVTFSGQHRMCLAMFLEVECVKVNIHKQIFLQEELSPI